MRVGHGFDLHRVDAERPLVLAGVAIPGPGLAGHSDADVVAHAVSDALLGAAGLGDIGELFPDSDDTWKDADSLELLARVVAVVRAERLRVASVDVTVLAERPKLSAFRDQMRSNLARVTGARSVGVKATTTEGMGSVGRGEAIACHAVALLRRRWAP